MEALVSYDLNDIFSHELDRISAHNLVETNHIRRPILGGKSVDNVVAKLSLAFSVGSSVKEVCQFAGISRDSYYRCVNKNPEFRNTLEQLRSLPVLEVRITIMCELLKGNLEVSKWYLERKCRDEFGK